MAKLEAEQEREEKARTLLEQAQAQLLSTLKDYELSFESYVRFFFQDIRKLVTKIEQERKRSANIKTTKRRVRKKAAKKKS